MKAYIVKVYTAGGVHRYLGVFDHVCAAIQDAVERFGSQGGNYRVVARPIK